MKSHYRGFFVSILILSIISPIPYSKSDSSLVPVHSIVSNMQIGMQEYQGPSQSNINYSLIFRFDFTIFNELNNPVGVIYFSEITPPVFVEYNFRYDVDTELTETHTVTDWIITKKTNPGNSTTSYTWNMDIFNYDKPFIPDGNFTLVPYKLQFGEELEDSNRGTNLVDRLTMTAVVVNSSVTYIQDDLSLCKCFNFFEGVDTNSSLVYLFEYTIILGLSVSLVSINRREKL